MRSARADWHFRISRRELIFGKVNCIHPLSFLSLCAVPFGGARLGLWSSGFWFGRLPAPNLPVPECVDVCSAQATSRCGWTRIQKLLCVVRHVALREHCTDSSLLDRPRVLLLHCAGGHVADCRPCTDSNSPDRLRILKLRCVVGHVADCALIANWGVGGLRENHIDVPGADERKTGSCLRSRRCSEGRQLGSCTGEQVGSRSQSRPVMPARSG